MSTTSAPDGTAARSNLLLAAGVFGWLVVILSCLIRADLRAAAPALWWVACVIHLCLLLSLRGAFDHPRSGRWHVHGFALLAVGLAAAGVWPANGLTPVLLVTNAWMIGFVFHRPWVIAILIGQSIFLAVVMPTQGLDVTGVAGYAALLAFATLMVEIAVREAHARQLAATTMTRLDEANAVLQGVTVELASAHARLADQSRVEERLRIARDVHQTVGHELTALSINLEVASHLTEGDAASHVAAALTLAKSALTNVRDAVSTMRDGSGNLRAEIESLAASTPSPRVSVDIGPQVDSCGREVVGVLVRVAREALMSAARHSSAETAVIRIVRDEDVVVLRVDDDGQGILVVSEGNGLRGMAERVGQLGGELTLTTGPGAGFHLEARIPVEGPVPGGPEQVRS